MNIEKLGIHGFASLASTKGGGFLSYLLTFALVGLAFAVRLLIAPVSAGLQYLTFFPAVTLACIVGGYRRGLFATAMGLVLATFIFTPPYFSFSFTVLTASLWSNLVFLADGLIVSFSIETMHRFRRRSEAMLEETVETKRRVQDLNEELRRRVLESERHGLELRRFEAIVASTDDAVISKSLEGTIQSWNAAAERLFGYSEEEVIGKPMTIFFPPDRLDEEAAILKRISQGERIEHFRTVRVHKSGSLVEVSATISPVRDASGRVVGASKIARDIGEVMRYEREREESSKQLESQLAEITMLKNSLQEQAIRDPLTCLF
ncbi:MAG: PAS domain S-box protein, partial [Spirochaetota bacterium]